MAVGVTFVWEQRKLGEVFEEYSDKGHPELPALTIIQGGGTVRRDESNRNLQFDSDSLSNYKTVNPGDFIVHLRSFEGGLEKAAHRGLISPAYHAFRSRGADSDFYYLYFRSNRFITVDLKPHVYGIRDGRSIDIEGMTTILIPWTNVEEQESIGSFFRHLDNLITLHQRKLELLKRLRNSLVDRCFIGEKYTMSKMILYHGSPNRVIVPKFGFGEDRHDYGRGFYLTESLELAKEWAVCRPDETNGWVHKYELEIDGLNILDFQKYDVLSWLAELMKHRDAADSRRYKMLAQKFIEKYGIDTCGYDVITGWRANASYFYIAKEFVRDNIDIEILEELLSLGGLGIQFCIKSERAFAQLSEVEQDIMSVDYSEFNDRYNERDINARNKMRALVDSDANKVTHVFSTLFER